MYPTDPKLSPDRTATAPSSRRRWIDCSVAATLAIVVAYALLFPPGLPGQTQPESLRPPDPVPSQLTCYSTIFEPFVLAEGDELRGADVDLLREVGRRLDMTIRFELIPWLRLEDSLRGRKSGIDCGFAFFRTEAREAYMVYTSVPLHVTDYVLFVRSEDSAANVAMPLQPGTTLAVNRGFSIPAEVEEAVGRGELELEMVSEESQSLRMLSLGRVDAVLTHRSVGSFVRDRLGLEGLVALEPPLLSRPAFLVFSNPSFRPLAQEIDRVLREIESDGTLAKIRARYALE